MTRLDGKVALITGAARGQGAAEAARFIEEGATVRLTGVLDHDGEETAASLGAAASYRHLDVTDADQWSAVVAEMVDDLGRIDVLVNNAGIFELGGLEAPVDLWERTIAINQTGVYFGMSTVAPTMRAQEAGSIINISSVAGLTGTPIALAYSASKWAVRGMTKCAALELAAHNVRVNSVHPGIIETAMLEAFTEFRERVDEGIPLGRTASAEEVANLVLFLATDESAYCTGHEFVIDGAMTA